MALQVRNHSGPVDADAQPITLYVSVVTLVSGFNVLPRPSCWLGRSRRAGGRYVFSCRHAGKQLPQLRVGYAASEACPPLLCWC